MKGGAACGMGLRKLGIQGQGAVVGVDGAGQVAQQTTAGPEVNMALFGSRAKQHGSFKRLLGPVEVAGGLAG